MKISIKIWKNQKKTIFVMSIYCHSECPRVSPATSYDSSRPLELSLIRLDGSTGSSQLVGAHGAFLTKISTFWSKNQWFSLIFSIFLLNFIVFRQQVTRTWLTSTWGCVGRPHCVRTSFMDRFRGLTEHNCLKTRLLGSPLRRQDAKSDGKWVLNLNINILEQNQWISLIY